MAASVSLTADQQRAAARIDALDLGPVAFGLMHPYPGLTVMGTAEADQVIAAYRCWLKLCAWYPDEPIVPSLPLDDAWLAHVMDTAKYAQDCVAAFGRFAHVRPHSKADGDAGWRAAYARTRALFRTHFGTDMPGGPARTPGHPEGTACCTDAAGRVRVFADYDAPDASPHPVSHGRARPPRDRGSGASRPPTRRTRPRG